LSEWLALRSRLPDRFPPLTTVSRPIVLQNTFASPHGTMPAPPSKGISSQRPGPTSPQRLAERHHAHNALQGHLVTAPRSDRAPKYLDDSRSIAQVRSCSKTLGRFSLHRPGPIVLQNTWTILDPSPRSDRAHKHLDDSHSIAQVRSCSKTLGRFSLHHPDPIAQVRSCPKHLSISPPRSVMPAIKGRKHPSSPACPTSCKAPKTLVMISTHVRSCPQTLGRFRRSGTCKL